MQARLRAQLGDQSISSGERRRRSVVVASIVLTITDPLRGSYTQLCYLQAALICSCGASFACMELTIICRFQRLLASTRLFAQSPFYGFSVPSPLACSQCVDTLLFASKHAKGMPLRYDAAPPSSDFSDLSDLLDLSDNQLVDLLTHSLVVSLSR